MTTPDKALHVSPLYVAANPWPLAAKAKELGLRTDHFRESDFVPDDKVFIIDVAALTRLPWERDDNAR